MSANNSYNRVSAADVALRSSDKFYYSGSPDVVNQFGTYNHAGRQMFGEYSMTKPKSVVPPSSRHQDRKRNSFTMGTPRLARVNDIVSLGSQSARAYSNDGIKFMSHDVDDAMFQQHHLAHHKSLDQSASHFGGRKSHPSFGKGQGRNKAFDNTATSDRISPDARPNEVNISKGLNMTSQHQLQNAVESSFAKINPSGQNVQNRVSPTNFAGSKFTEAPDASFLPKPPVHWISGGGPGTKVQNSLTQKVTPNPHHSDSLQMDSPTMLLMSCSLSARQEGILHGRQLLHQLLDAQVNA